MKQTDGFYLEEDVVIKLKENAKKRGDKSKIANKALREYFKEELNKEIPKVTIRV